MNLINNEDGTWDQAKTNIHQDLTNIQAVVNQILAKINATPDPTIPPAAVIAPSNQVTIPNGVFTKHLGALMGNGLVATPLGVNVDGTTVTVNDLNQLVAGGSITVDPAGALSGNGSSGSPLAVKVDGVTITINGSDELVAAGSGGITIVQKGLGNAALFAATPQLLLAGTPGKINWPFMVTSTIVGDGTMGFSTSGTLAYNTTGTAITGSFPLTASVGAGAGIWTGVGVAVNLARFPPADPSYPVSAPIYIIPGGATGGAGAGGNSAVITLAYFQI